MNIYDVPVDDTVFFPVSGDELRRQTLREENDGRSPRKEKATTDQCQIDMKDTEMSTNDSTNNGSVKSPDWAIPSRMSVFGQDVMHIGQSMKLERANRNGDSYFLSATPQQLEEIGQGFTTDKYVALLVDSEPFGETVLNLDLEELETIADWLCAVVEKMKP